MPTVPADDLPLTGMLVLDFSQFLSGPVAALRLADLGARVIKVERPLIGDIGRGLSFAGLTYDSDTLSFHAMNRRKQSLAADLKDPASLDQVRRLVARADVLISNFRPGVMERIGLDFESVRQLNPRIVYATITGYGSTGPWRSMPGQDLLAQSLSGLLWMSGNDDQGPVPVGVSLADLLASIHLAQGVVALLLRRERTGRGGLVETSLLEGLLDLQFELLTARCSADHTQPQRGRDYNASPFIDAPYGVYRTIDGYLSIAMTPIPALGALIELPALGEFVDPLTWWTERDRITALLAHHLATRDNAHWLAVLRAADVWCAPVLTVDQLAADDAFAALEMIQPMIRPATDHRPAVTLHTTRSPLRIDGRYLTESTGAPRLGADTDGIIREFDLVALTEDDETPPTMGDPTRWPNSEDL